MRVRSLRTAGFRNLAAEEFLPGESVNVLYGDNGQGKTNLLEALWLFTGEKSFRGSGGGELVRFGGRAAKLALQFTAHGVPNEIRLSFGAERTASLNGASEDSAAGLIGTFCAVVFSPDHLGLVKEGPRIRRQFLDAAICQLWPRHAAVLSGYGRALVQRNALLKDIPGHSELLDTASVWDEKLASLGARVQFARLRYLTRLAPAAADRYDGIAGGGEPLSVSYVAADGEPLSLVPGEPQEAARARLEDRLRSAYQSGLQKDVERGFTAAGPHRDELMIRISGMPARLFGSQGQQRSAVLALKLAEAAVLKDTLGEPPVLLLDDVMSELDGARRDYLLNHLGGYQIFITCCDPSGFSTLGEGRIFEVRGGRVTPAGKDR